MSKTRAIALLLLVGVTAAIGIGTAFGQSRAVGGQDLDDRVQGPIGIEGLTLDDRGNLYVPQRGGAGGCTIVRVSATGGANQPGVAVARINPPCNPAGHRVRAGRTALHHRLRRRERRDRRRHAERRDPANPPVVTGFATGVPGANGVAFDEDGALYVSDGGTAQGRVFRVGPSGGAATVIFRVPTMANAAGVGRQNQALQPGSAAATQSIVANGLAFDDEGTLYVADTARGAIWQVGDKHGVVRAPLGCDTTFPADTLCLDALYVQHPALDGADGIALDKKGNIYVAPNERNSIAVVDTDRRVTELFRNPVAASGLRNAGPLEFPTSPVLAGKTLCTTSWTATAATTRRTPQVKRHRRRQSSARCPASTSGSRPGLAAAGRLDGHHVTRSGAAARGPRPAPPGRLPACRAMSGRRIGTRFRRKAVSGRPRSVVASRSRRPANEPSNEPSMGGTADLGSDVDAAELRRRAEPIPGDGSW